MNWLTVSFMAIAFGACIYFDRLDRKQRKHDAMIEREEQKIRDDAQAIRKWYEGQRFTIEGDNEAEIAERLIEAS